MPCGDLGPLEGGLIKDSTIVDSTFTGGEIRSADLVGLASCDAQSAQTISAALAAAGPASLGTPESATEGSELPTGMFGSRDAVLGQPAAWAELGGYVVPLYRKA